MKLAWKLATSIPVLALLATCVFNFISSPRVLCLMDGKCDNVSYISAQGIYSRTIAVTCFVSYSTLSHEYCTVMPVLERNVRAYETYMPTTAAQRRHRALFYAALLALHACVTVPVNALRVLLLDIYGVDQMVLVFFVFMYTQNACMCLVETRFVTLCRALDEKFADINRDLARLGCEVPDPGVVNVVSRAADLPPLHRVTYCDDFYGARPAIHSIANAVEVLRIRHRLIREAAYLLIDLFGVPVGMSLIALCIMPLFDIYYQVYDVMGANTRSTMFICAWLLQYAIRFYTIVVTAHNMTKQVKTREKRSKKEEERGRAGSDLVLV